MDKCVPTQIRTLAATFRWRSNRDPLRPSHIHKKSQRKSVGGAHLQQP